ncbi:hypothetical protein LJK88_20550 [Paenibacillus sp. P26]|nr:hypothetical protein LJK88_38185 [Paenibacillus sp. P26]UUZ85679.1 hypothetical protein LJK88_20550 [Paenibacillus sp. P26]UUZ93260.1 hypothetical protein LJK87_00110 [Paenibacillus sp. P25]UUZ95974.1 hypothetical protein LJK87_17315 [Paenibacillus sp. P25]
MPIQHYANADANGNLIGFYNDDVWDPEKIPATAVKITEDDWRDAVSNPGKYIIQDGAMVLAPPPTVAELLARAQEAKIAELNAACSAAINGRFTSKVDGVSYQFSFDAEAQSNFVKAGRAFDKGLMTSIRWTAYDQAGAIVRIDLDAAAFDAVFKDSLEHLNTQLSKFRDTLRPQVMACTTVEEVQAITYDG